jgi:hypothetical protein
MSILSSSRALVSGLAVGVLVLGGIALGAAPAEAASTSTWDEIAQCEASGNWHIDTGNGYYGGLQFSMGTWRAHGGSGNPARNTKAKQIKIAEKVLSSQGWGAWPACSSKLGLHGTPAKHAKKHHAKKHHAKKHVTKKHVTHAKASKRTVVVHAGDTLSRIASRKHVKGGWHRLAAVNPQLKDVNVLHVGQRLHLPA